METWTCEMALHLFENHPVEKLCPTGRRKLVSNLNRKYHSYALIVDW